MASTKIHRDQIHGDVRFDPISGARKFNPFFHHPARYPPDGRTVKHVKIHSSLDIFLKSWALALASNLRAARSHERNTSRPVGAG
jgi:hypothetical protein